MSDPTRIVIIGGGRAGDECARALRQGGFTGAVTIVCGEASLPYQRPPLSKQCLLSPMDEDILQLRPASAYALHDIHLVRGVCAREIDVLERHVILQDGCTLDYDHLVLATGSKARTLPVPGSNLGGLHVLHDLPHVHALQSDLREARQLLILGAGFVGLEVAFAARKLGVEVTVVEARSRVLARAVSEASAGHLARSLQAQGVQFVFDRAIVSFTGTHGRVARARLDDGIELDADTVLVGIGAVANDDLARGAGLAVDHGVVVDEYLRTRDARISAIGDCARFPLGGGRGTACLESVQNAVDQAKYVAGRLLGMITTPYEAVPWFWSDQGPNRLQMVGLGPGSTAEIVCGDLAQGSFSVLCFAEGRLCCVESVNRPADHMAARRLLAARVPLPLHDAAAPDFDLKAWVKAALEGLAKRHAMYLNP